MSSDHKLPAENFNRIHLCFSFLDILDFVDHLRKKGELEYPKDKPTQSYEEKFLVEFKQFLLKQYNTSEDIVKQDSNIVRMMRNLTHKVPAGVDLQELSKDLKKQTP